jgi:hypothetical protein
MADLVLSKITDDLMHSSDRKKAKAAKFTSRDSTLILIRLEINRGVHAKPNTAGDNSPKTRL